VIPVQMGDERGAAETAVLGQRVAPVPQPRAEIENDRFGTGRLEGDARRVASVAQILLARARRRASYAVEGDVEQWAPRSGCCAAVVPWCAVQVTSALPAVFFW
jgi:hypothetical protein